MSESEYTFEMEESQDNPHITGTIFISLQGRVWMADFSHTSLGASLTASLGSPIVPTPFTKAAPLDHVRRAIEHQNPGCHVSAIGMGRSGT